MVSWVSFLSNISLTEISPDVSAPVGEVSVLTSFLKEISPKDGVDTVLVSCLSDLVGISFLEGCPMKGTNSTKSVKLFFFLVRF